MKTAILLFALLALTNCGQKKQERPDAGTTQQAVPGQDPGSRKATTAPDSIRKAGERHYPFTIRDGNDPVRITASLEAPELYPKYHTFFAEQKYEGNGYCWEGHVTQILEELDKELLDHIEFDPEAGMFLAYADSKESAIRFVTVLSPIFSDLQKLGTWVKKADRSRIDD